MTAALQLRRGTAAEHTSFTGSVGEITYDTTDKRAVVHDGSTAGGIPLAKESEIVAGGYSPGGTDVALEDGGTGASLTAPTSDRIMFWDDSAGEVTWLAPGTGMSISGTNLNTSAYTPSGTDVALADGGTGASLSDPGADRVMFWDDSANSVAWLNPDRGFNISGTNLNVNTATTSVEGISELATDAETITGTATDKSVTPSNLTGASIYGYMPQNSKSAAYTLVASDQSKHIFHPSADTTPRTWTIPANASVAFPVGTTVTFINQNGAGAITIAITSDTLRLAGAGTTGSRTLAANGVATAVKVTSTEWIISGTGLT